MSKGILQSLEAVIAILMILAVFVVYYAPREPLPELETISWKLRGFNALRILDESNELRLYVLENNSLQINRTLQSILPAYLNYDVVICELNCSKPDVETEKLVSVSYIIAGNMSRFDPKQIVLYVW